MMARNNRDSNMKRKFDSKTHMLTENEDLRWINKISEINKVEELIPFIIAQIEAPQTYYKMVDSIQRDLDQVMRFFYRNPRVKVHPFGSSMTKLALKGSDIDFYLDFGGNLPDSSEKFLKTLRNQVRKFGYFNRPIAIFAKVPIVQCIHRSGISCDISFLNGLSLCNTKIVQFMTSVDKRIRPVFMILKFLLKRQGLIGSNDITSFSLTLLIIYYLQQLEKPLLPTVSFLQNLVTSTEITAEWETSFCSDLNVLPPVENQSSICELVKDFFKFYSTFEFGFYVISVYTGKAYLKPIFADLNLLPQEFKCYKNIVEKDRSYQFWYDKLMCVQGPFNHSRNVTYAVSQKLLQRFQTFCSESAAFYEVGAKKNQETNCESTYLLNLFQKNKESFERQKMKIQCICLYVGQGISSTNHDLSALTEENLRLEWFERVFKAVNDALTKVMKCEVKDETDNLNNQPSGFRNSQVKKILKCKMPHVDLITKKSRAARQNFQFPDEMSVIDQEEIISDYLYASSLRDIPQDWVEFEIICVLKKEPTHLCVMFESKQPLKTKYLADQTFRFMEINFPKWIK